MAKVTKKDFRILGFTLQRGEVFFRELEEAEMMAKSTLCKHLKELVEQKLIRKTISKTRSRANHVVVYVTTPRGKRTYFGAVGRHTYSLEDF